VRKSTRQIVDGARRSDPTVSDQQWESAIAILEGSTPPVTPELLKQRDVAAMLSVSRQTVLSLTKEGKLHPVELTPGRTFSAETRHGTSYTRSTALVRFRREEVLALVRGGAL